MKGFIKACFLAVVFTMLASCATNGREASYEGYNMANQGNPASTQAATMVAPITTRIPPRLP